MVVLLEGVLPIDYYSQMVGILRNQKMLIKLVSVFLP